MRGNAVKKRRGGSDLLRRESVNPSRQEIEKKNEHHKHKGGCPGELLLDLIRHVGELEDQNGQGADRIESTVSPPR